MAATRKPMVVENVDALEPMLTRLKLTAIRDQLDTLLDQAARAEMNLREALAMLCTAEVARKDERRIQMGMSIAKFPYVRTLEGFECQWHRTFPHFGPTSFPHPGFGGTSSRSGGDGLLSGATWPPLDRCRPDRLCQRVA